MRILSVNVGKPRAVETPRGVVLTSIFKVPVAGRKAVRGFNIEGDQQADLTVHGGVSKAVYAYPWEHYDFWKSELGEELTPGNFGENLTTEGLLEEEVNIGDKFQVGSAVLRVTQPRMPCAKLALRFDRSDMVKRFWKSGFSGIYFAIDKEGDLEAGDAIERISSSRDAVSIADVLRLFKGESQDEELFERAMATPLSGSWKEEIQERYVRSR